jgi:hypothetical protein
VIQILQTSAEFEARVWLAFRSAAWCRRAISLVTVEASQVGG